MEIINEPTLFEVWAICFVSIFCRLSVHLMHIPALFCLLSGANFGCCSEEIKQLIQVPMADLRGKSSNHLDDLFATLEEWEAAIQSLEEFPVDHHTANLPKLESD